MRSPPCPSSVRCFRCSADRAPECLPNGEFIHIADDWKDASFSLGGFFGVSLGARSGFEVNFLGLVAGLDFQNPGIKIPGLGYFGTNSFEPAPERKPVSA